MLPTQLQTVLDGLKNTPIDEPKITKALEVTPLKKSKVINLILKDTELNIKDFTALEIAEFFKAVIDKITNKKDENGVYKSTPKTENLQLPNFEEVEDIIELLSELNVIRAEQDDLQKMVANDEEIKPEAMADTIKKFETCLTKLDEMVWKISKLKKADLTQWEQLLVSDQLISTASDVTKTSVGKL